MRTLRCFLTLVSLLSLAGFVSAQAPGESPEEFEQRMQWWSDGRLGLFLHWGVYSTFGGEYGGRDHGKEMGQTSAEWIYHKAKIPLPVYKNAAMGFEAAKYDPIDWIRQAKAAGMKYAVLTSKHHDGFALFDTKASDWNAVKSSGARRDLIREFVDACHQEGVKVGFYYSHEKDWVHHSRSTRSLEPVPEAYVELVKTQLHELFTNYGTIDLIWFDTPVAEHEELNRMCASIVRRLQPQCIINGRIGNNLGDYRNIGDRAIVDPGLGGYFESIMTMRLNWGFDRNDDYWKSSYELIRMVSQSVCRGSNFLLNIGPTPEGTFPPEDQVRLRDLGNWIQVFGEAVYATRGNPFLHEHRWGSITISEARQAVYLHLWNWDGGDIDLHGLTSKVAGAGFIDTHETLEFDQDLSDARLRVSMPEANTQNTVRIVRLALETTPAFDRDRGPGHTTTPVHHVTHAMITGSVTAIDGVDFSVTGRRIVSDQAGAEIYSADVETISFTLNEHTRYRINDDGDIRAVQGFDLEPGARYHVVYAPLPENPVVEIITLVK